MSLGLGAAENTKGGGGSQLCKSGLGNGVVLSAAVKIRHTHVRRSLSYDVASRLKRRDTRIKATVTGIINKANMPKYGPGDRVKPNDLIS